MLDKIKNSYKDLADSYLGAWDKINRNKLCDMYLDNKDNRLSDAYLSAIIFSFWRVFEIMACKYYTYVSDEDCYEFYIDTIRYVLDKHTWRDPNSTTYNDPNAPEKCMMVRLRCLLLNCIRDKNTMKRIANTESYSYEGILESIDVPGADFEDPDSTCENYHLDASRCLIQEYFSKKKYMSAFVTHVLSKEKCTKVENDNIILCRNKISQSIRKINKNFCDEFAMDYNLDVNEVYRAADECTALPRTTIYRYINNSINEIKSSHIIKEISGRC